MRKFLLAALIAVAIAVDMPALGQGTTTIGGLPSATFPLSCNEVAPIVQGGITSKLSACQLGIDYVGTVAPPSPSLGQRWLNNTGPIDTISQFDGSQWLQIGSFDPTGHTYQPASTYMPVLNYSTLSSFTAAQMAAGARFWLTSYYTGETLGVAYAWVPATNSGSYKVDGGLVIKPSGDTDCTAHGCLVAQLNGKGISPEMFGAHCRGLASDGANDTTGVTNAIGAALSHFSYGDGLGPASQTVSTAGVCALNSSISIINFANNDQVIRLGGVMPGSSFPAKTAWNNATSFFTIGGSGGTMTGLNLEIGQATGINADVVHIVGVGLGHSHIHIGTANNVNGVIEIANTSTVTDGNRFTGNRWNACDDITLTCGSFGLYSAPLYTSSAHAESNILDVGFIRNFTVAGVLESDGTHFGKYLSSMEENGTHSTQLCVSSSANFAVGNTITQGTTGATGTILAIYPWRGTCTAMLVLESHLTAATTAHPTGQSSFVVNATSPYNITNAPASGVASVGTVLPANVAVDPESFDIVSNHQTDQPKSLIHAAYLGGIVGNGLFSDDLQYENGSSYTHCFQGVCLYSSGGTSSLSNSSVDPTLPQLSFNSSGMSLPQGSGAFTVGNSNNTQTFPSASGTVTNNAATQTLTNKTISGSSNTFSNIPPSALNNFGSGTWTPTDASGATLTFTGVQTAYTKFPGFCQAWFDLTYPTTANASSAIIGGLPCTSNATNMSHAIMGVSTSGTSGLTFDGANNATQFSILSSGTPQTNANMSGKRVIGYVTTQGQ